jgi:putative ABC transport system permease protein
MGTFWQDLRYGVRMLLKQRGFTVVAILTLALGIGANSAIFSVVNAVLLRPLPYKEPDRLVKLWETFLPSGYGTVSVANLKDWREQNDVFTGLSAYQVGNFNLQGEEHPERVPGAGVTGNFFDIVGVPPRLGRTFQEGDDRQGNHRVVILSSMLWQRNYGSDPEIVGKNIQLGGENFTVIGVMPESFRYPGRSIGLWVPLVLPENQASNRGFHNLMVLGRLKPAATFAQAQEQMSAIARRIAEQYPGEQEGRGIRLILLQEEVVQNVRPALLVLLGAVGFVLLIACTNVANLLLARAATRRREIAIRTALGAGRGRLIRQFLTESLLLSFLGGILGLFVAYWGIDLLLALGSNFLPRAYEVALDLRVVGFTLLLSLVTGIGFGLAPALQITKTDVQVALKEGGVGDSARRNWLRGLLVTAEIASALVLLIGAGLLIKSFIGLNRMETGLKPENVLTVRITLPEAKYPKPPAAAAFYQQMLNRVSALPGIQASGIINLLPLQEWGYNGDLEIEGEAPYQPGQAPRAEFRSTSSGYFQTFGIPLLAGRLFNDQDQEKTIPVLIINKTFAERYFAGKDPIGKRIRGGASNDWVTIIGVVGDVKQSGLTQPARAEIFLPYTQTRYSSLMQSMTLVVRSQTDPTNLTSAIRAEVQAVDPIQPIYNVQKMETVIADSFSDHRLNTILLSIFATLAMLLAMIGIYSVMSYTVTQNTREIGIRMALGAQRRDIYRLVVGQGILLTLIGVVIGLIGSLALTRFLSSLLFGVTATDPITLAGVSILLVLVAIAACYIPARRATKVDPMVALRYE